MSKNPKIQPAATREHLEQICVLNRENHEENVVDPVAKKRDGFLKVAYDLETLVMLTENGTPPVIAIDQFGHVVGYVILCSRRAVFAFGNRVDKEDATRNSTPSALLSTLVAAADTDSLFNDTNYLIIAQICVASSFRGRGLPAALYDIVACVYGNEFPCAIAEIAQSNERSLRAHAKLGWRVREESSYSFRGVDWIFVHKELQSEERD